MVRDMTDVQNTAPSASRTDVSARTRELMRGLGVALAPPGTGLTCRSPITGEIVGDAPVMTSEAARDAITRAATAFEAWRLVPAPRRGELVRLLGEELRTAKPLLG